METLLSAACVLRSPIEVLCEAQVWPESPAQSGISSDNGNLRPLTSPSGTNYLDVRLTSDKMLFMANTLIDSVVKQLQQERARLEDELHRVTAALTTFGKVYLEGNKRRSAATPAPAKKRTISAAGRRRIAAAQRARWAKVRAGKK